MALRCVATAMLPNALAPREKQKLFTAEASLACLQMAAVSPVCCRSRDAPRGDELHKAGKLT